MESVQFIIRAAIKVGKFPAPVKAEGFSAYAIASGLGLVPEAEDAARLTLGQPMTFESLGEELRLFKGRTLFDLIRYRKYTQRKCAVDEWNAWRLRVAEDIAEVRPPAQRASTGLAARKEKVEEEDKEVIEVWIDEVIEQFEEVVESN